MACLYPIKAYRSAKVGPNGKRPVVVVARGAFVDRPVWLPCLQCVSCRLDRSAMWACRCTHEASLYEENSFVTLTYAEQNLPANGSLVYRDFQLFMKRLRKSRGGQKIRFYMCGEYGENFGRPHFHVLLFNVGFSDKKLYKQNRNGDSVYTSEMLSRVWTDGMSTVGAVTWQSASYTARYVMKKVTGKVADAHYQGREPEFNEMSKGIGRGWFEKFPHDVFPHDDVVVNGRSFKVPRYYDNLFELEVSEKDFRRLKNKRLRNAMKHADNNTPDRLAVRAEVLNARIRNLKRSDV